MLNEVTVFILISKAMKDQNMIVTNSEMQKTTLVDIDREH